MNFFRVLLAFGFVALQVACSITSAVESAQQEMAHPSSALNDWSDEPTMMLRGAGGEAWHGRQLGVINDFFAAIGNFIQAILNIFF